MSETEPSARAMRVAEAIWDAASAKFLHLRPHRRQIAAIVDEQAGLPELVAAFEQIIAASEQAEDDATQDVHGTYCTGFHAGWFGAADIARAALKLKDAT